MPTDVATRRGGRETWADDANWSVGPRVSPSRPCPSSRGVQRGGLRAGPGQCGSARVGQWLWVSGSRGRLWPWASGVLSGRRLIVQSSQACRQEGGAALFPGRPVLPRGFVSRGPAPRCETARRANLRSGTVHSQRCGSGLGGWAPGARDSNPADPLGRPEVPVPRVVTRSVGGQWVVSGSAGAGRAGGCGLAGACGSGPRGEAGAVGTAGRSPEAGWRTWASRRG